MRRPFPERGLIPPMRPRVRQVSEGVLPGACPPSLALAKRCIELINEDRIRAETIPKGWFGR